MRVIPVAMVLMAAALAACSNGDALAPRAQDASGRTAALLGPPAMAVVPSGCSRYESTNHAEFTGTGWVQTNYVTVDGVPLTNQGGGATGDADERAIERMINGQPYRGAEQNTAQYAEGTLYSEDSYTGQPGPTAGLWYYHASGKFTGGTGQFEGATGTFESQGPFIVWPALDDPNGAIYIGYSVGHICLPK